MAPHPALDGLADPLPVPFVSAPLSATVDIPGSKSITNRALICAALADGVSTLTRVLDSDDTNAMVGCLRTVGIDVSIDGDRAEVRGSGGRVPISGVTLDANQSGTTARFMVAVAALADGPIVVDGHPQMRGRPMRDGIDAVRALGSEVLDSDGGLPITVSPGRTTPSESTPADSTPTESTPTVSIRGDVSSQFLTGLLLAAPCLAHGLVIEVDGHLQSAPYVTMTVSVMQAFGARVEVDRELRRFEIAATGYRARTYDIEPDASAASYPLAAAALCGGTVTVPGLGRNSLQGDVHFAETLRAFGATVEIADDQVTVTGGDLKGGSFDMAAISDTAQTLAALAPYASAPTEIFGIGFIRRKETDRIGGVVTELRRLGVRAEELEDGLRIEPGPISPAVVETYEDHRMAMSFAVLGLRSKGVQIADPGCVSKTFPTFWDMLGELVSASEPDRPADDTTNGATR